MEHVELRNVSKSFGELEIIRRLNLRIEKGKFYALLGPSGCGKSTLLRLIAGLEPVTAGNVFINGEDVTHTAPVKRKIAMVFQSYALYPHMNVRDNIAFSLDIAGVPKTERYGRADKVANLLQLNEFLDRRPGQLSGGQRQRVAIGRALVRDPEVFLFDEPLSNLDAKLRVQMRFELANLHQTLDTTMVYVTHDQVEAMTLADKIVVLEHGRISQIGTPLELYNKPDNKFVASFIGSPSMNFLAAAPREASGKGVNIDLSGAGTVSIETRSSVSEAPHHGNFEIGIRPEHIQVGGSDDAEAAFAGRVHLVEHLGNSTLLHIESQAGRVAAQVSGDDQTNVGDSVGVILDANKAHLFASNQQVV
jgi:multiple sugar transport system ATP-binding protein